MLSLGYVHFTTHMKKKTIYLIFLLFQTGIKMPKSEDHQSKSNTKNAFATKLSPNFYQQPEAFCFCID